MNSAELAAITLPRTRFKAGFAVDEVDDFIALCVAALRAGEQGRPAALSADAIVIKQFRQVRFVDAYDADAVDDLLDQVVFQLREFHPLGSGSDVEPTPPSLEELAKSRRITIGLRAVTVVLVLVSVALVVWKATGA